MTVDISHLVVIGCSFAYCQGLESPKTQGWPALVANKLGVPVVNLSGKGAGNDKIMRRLFEYHNLNLEHGNNPFYIISFSHSSRREEYTERMGDYTIVDMHPTALDKYVDEFSKPCLVNYNQEIMSRRKLMLQSYIINFLRANNLNYLTTDYLPDHQIDIELYAKGIFPKAYEDVFNDKRNMKSFSEFSKQNVPLPCGHDDLVAQSQIKEYLLPKLQEVYGEVNVVDKPFTTLTDYANYYTINGILRGIESDWF